MNVASRKPSTTIPFGFLLLRSRPMLFGDYGKNEELEVSASVQIALVWYMLR